MSAFGAREKLAWGVAFAASCAALWLGLAPVIGKGGHDKESPEAAGASAPRPDAAQPPVAKSPEEPAKVQATPPGKPDRSPLVISEEDFPVPKKTEILSLVGVARQGEKAEDRLDAIYRLAIYMNEREDDDYVEEIISAFEFVARYDAAANIRKKAQSWLSDQYSLKAFDAWLDIIHREEDPKVRWNWLEDARNMGRDGNYDAWMDASKPRSNPPSDQDIQREYVARALRTARTLKQMAETWTDPEYCKAARGHAVKLCENVILDSTDDNQVSEAKAIRAALQK
ncbi:MAG: hypothetical protein HYY18_09325 [Planctomycetes bacterium]|nr:hypothetical protein [Planctomycetota bacterium]